jgi:hypothetical protein
MSSGVKGSPAMRPDLRARDARSYPRNCCDLFIGLNNCFSTGIVTGYDASYIDSRSTSPFTNKS